MAYDDVDQTREIKQLVVSSGGTFTMSGATKTRTGQVYKFPVRVGNPGATATVGYVKSGADTCMLTLAQNATADTYVIHLTGFKCGDIVTSMGIAGQIESGGNAVTIDYELREMTAVATGCTDASLQAGTQIAKSADYLVNDSTDLATPHICGEGEQMYMLITCTTAATTDIELLYVSLTVTEK